MPRQEILEKAVLTYGDEAQCIMCMEECAELIQAISKAYRTFGTEKHQKAVDAVREEIADVQIMLDQMRIIYGDTAEQEAFKLQRLVGRLEARP